MHDRPAQPIWPFVVSASYSSAAAAYNVDGAEPTSATATLEALVATALVRAAVLSSTGVFPGIRRLTCRGKEAAGRYNRLAKVAVASADTPVQEANAV